MTRLIRIAQDSSMNFQFRTLASRRTRYGGFFVAAGTKNQALGCIVERLFTTSIARSESTDRLEGIQTKAGEQNQFEKQNSDYPCGFQGIIQLTPAKLLRLSR